MCHQTKLLAYSKSDKYIPKWVTHSLPKSSSGTYIFISSHGQGSSLAEAKQQAFVAMSQKLEVERNIIVNTNVQIRERLSQSQSTMGYEYNQEMVMDVIENGQKLKIVCREIDDYWVALKGKYEVDVLYAVANSNVYGGSFDDAITVSSQYGNAGFLSIIPSVGQFYKGCVVKGSFILASEVIAIGGILLCENTCASYIKKMREQPQYAIEYNSLADSWSTGRNLCIGVATAIYVYNLIDAFTTIGAKRVYVKNSNASLSINPYVDAHLVGFGLTLQFK
ncbi:MAG TPA: hypothetical protein DHU75_07440 [Rikenellaceae bacterium]|nr:hypothetical protein [Rikenellaceae bacterium]